MAVDRPRREAGLGQVNAAPPAPAAAAPRTRALWWLWLGTCLLLMGLAHGNLESTDTAVTMQGARALWLRGDSGLLRASDGGEWLAETMLADYIVAAAPNGMGRTGADGRHQYVWFPIGHLYALVPFVALGEWLAQVFPGVEGEYRRRTGDAFYHEGQFVLDQAAIALLLPPLVGATTLVLLWLIARALGCGERQCLLVAATIVFGTQCLATARETISNGCGLVFLLAAVLVAVRAQFAAPSRRALVAAGLAAGAAVLCRYQQAAMLVPLGLLLGVAAWRRRRLGELAWFGLGGLPLAVLLLAVNHARFADPTVTGYPPLGTWAFNYPIWLGLPRMLIAASKGILWLSPLLWVVLPALVRRSVPVPLRWFAIAALALPMAMFSMLTGGWQSGQCWGSRYVTDGIVLASVLVLAGTRPWQRWPRAFWLTTGLGLLVNVTGIVAPVRGHAQLAAQATVALYEGELARGAIAPHDLAAVRVDLPDHFYMEWWASVLHANWRYAAQSLRGAWEDPAGRPRNGVEHTIGPVFAITSADPAHGAAPGHWEDRAGRHLGSKFWGDLLGVPWWLLLLPVLVAAATMLSIGWRRLSRD